MKKRLNNALRFFEQQTRKNLSQEERRSLKEDLLTQIAFFQHERLCHLIVTLGFALLTLLTACCAFLLRLPGLYLLLGVFLALFLPYIWHYYVLENGVQKLYTYYDSINSLPS